MPGRRCRGRQVGQGAQHLADALDQRVLAAQKEGHIGAQAEPQRQQQGQKEPRLAQAELEPHDQVDPRLGPDAEAGGREVGMGDVVIREVEMHPEIFMFGTAVALDFAIGAIHFVEPAVEAVVDRTVDMTSHEIIDMETNGMLFICNGFVSDASIVMMWQ